METIIGLLPPVAQLLEDDGERPSRRDGNSRGKVQNVRGNSSDVFLFRAVCGNHIIWGFHHVAGFRRRHVGASIQEAWTTSLENVRATLDADPVLERTAILRATTQELGQTRQAVLDAVVQRVDLSQKQAAEAFTVAEQNESNPRSVWGYVQGLTRLSQRTPWQDGRFALDRAASRLLATVN